MMASSEGNISFNGSEEAHYPNQEEWSYESRALLKEADLAGGADTTAISM